MSMSLRCLGVMGDVGGHTKRSLGGHFLAMSVAFSVNHAVSTTPLLLASTLLGGGVGVTGNSVFFFSAMVASAVVSVPATGYLGVRRALAASLGLYALYAGGFAAALGAARAGAGAATVSATWIAASACGGVAGSMAWTAQGAYFATSASMLATLTEKPKEEYTASLSSTFSIIYLTTEVIAKVGISLLQARWQADSVAWVFFAIAAAFAFASMWLKDLPGAPQTSAFQRCTGAVAMWGDPVIWLLSPTNLAFGFGASFLNGYINGTFASVELGDHFVGALGGLTSGTAAVTAFLLGRLTGARSRALVIAFGAVCFFGMSFCTTALNCCSGWGRWIMVLYVLQGMGRAVYESTNRAVFANFFPGEDTELAFANCCLQVNFSKALCYGLQTQLTGHRLASILGMASAATPVCYCLAVAFRAKAVRWSRPIGDTELDEGLVG